MKNRAWRWLHLPLLDALALVVIFLSWACYFSHLLFDRADVSPTRFLSCLAGHLGLGLWIVLVVLVVEAVIHSILRTFATDIANRKLTPLADGIALGSTAGGLLLYVRFQHNSQGEMYVMETGRVDWAYAATMFFLPLVVLLTELIVHRAARYYSTVAWRHGGGD